MAGEVCCVGELRRHSKRHLWLFLWFRYGRRLPQTSPAIRETDKRFSDGLLVIRCILSVFSLSVLLSVVLFWSLWRFSRVVLKCWWCKGCYTIVRVTKRLANCRWDYENHQKLAGIMKSPRNYLWNDEKMLGYCPCNHKSPCKLSLKSWKALRTVAGTDNPW